MTENKNILVLLEFGFPPYRRFIFDYLASLPNICLRVVHSGEKFPSPEIPKNYQIIQEESYKIGRFVFLRNIASHILWADVVLASFNVYRPSTWLPLLWSKKPFIIWNPGGGNNVNSFLNKTFRKYFIAKSVHYLVYTEKARLELIEKWQIRPQKISSIGNTIPVSFNESYINQKKYLLFVGRLQERKGLELAIQAIRKLNNAGKPVQFKIIGDGSSELLLKQLVTDFEVSHLVSLHPATFDENEISNYFKDAIAYLSPLAIGLGVIEAFGHGVPPIFMEHGYHGKEKDLTNNQNSWFCNTPADLENAIEEAVSNPNLWQEKHKQARKTYLEHCNPKYTLQVFERVLLNK